MAAFSLDILRLYWIGGTEDDPKDLCLHGDVRIVIGAETVAGDCTVSAGALQLMRSVFDDYAINDVYRLLPCCGHSMYAAADGERVEFIGCPYGLDFAVTHAGGEVILQTRGGTRVILPLADYRAQVTAFADGVRGHYETCAPKETPADAHDRAGYEAFWREWNTLRARL